MGKKNAPYDYTGLVLLKSLDVNTMCNIRYSIKKGLIEQIKTPQGFAITQEAFDNYEGLKVGRKAVADKSTARVDLTEGSKFKALYIRAKDLNKQNYASIFINYGNKKLKKYIDQDGYVCISIMDWIDPQITRLAEKLQVKKTFVKQALYDLIKKAYDEREKDNKKELAKKHGK